MDEVGGNDAALKASQEALDASNEALFIASLSGTMHVRVVAISCPICSYRTLRLPCFMCCMGC